MVFLNVVIYKVFIFFGLFYINMEILKRGFFFGNMKYFYKWLYICWCY